MLSLQMKIVSAMEKCFYSVILASMRWLADMFTLAKQEKKPWFASFGRNCALISAASVCSGARNASGNGTAKRRIILHSTIS